MRFLLSENGITYSFVFLNRINTTRIRILSRSSLYRYYERIFCIFSQFNYNITINCVMYSSIKYLKLFWTNKQISSTKKGKITQSLFRGLNIWHIIFFLYKMRPTPALPVLQSNLLWGSLLSPFKANCCLPFDSQSYPHTNKEGGRWMNCGIFRIASKYQLT